MYVRFRVNMFFTGAYLKMQMTPVGVSGIPHGPYDLSRRHALVHFDLDFCEVRIYRPVAVAVFQDDVIAIPAGRAVPRVLLHQHHLAVRRCENRRLTARTEVDTGMEAFSTLQHPPPVIAGDGNISIVKGEDEHFVDIVPLHRRIAADAQEMPEYPALVILVPYLHPFGFVTSNGGNLVIDRYNSH